MKLIAKNETFIYLSNINDVKLGTLLTHRGSTLPNCSVHIDAHWVLRTFGMQASMQASMRAWTRFLTLILVCFVQGA